MTTPTTLLCLSYAGGTASAVYRDWALWLSPDITVVPLDLPGCGSRRQHSRQTASRSSWTRSHGMLSPTSGEPGGACSDTASGHCWPTSWRGL